MPTHAKLRALLNEHLPDLYRFAFFMTARREDALEQLRYLVNEAESAGVETLVASGDARTELVAMLARGLEHRLGRRASFTFDGLDQTLRNDITRPIDMQQGDLRGDPRRLHVMLWELERTCLVSTLCALPASVRLAVVLTDLFGYPPEQAARMLGINDSAYRVRATRGRKRLTDYLAPRCQHMDPDNPCNCAGRLSIAMDAGFVTFPPDHAQIPHTPHDSGGRAREATVLLRALPDVQLRSREVEDLLGAL